MITSLQGSIARLGKSLDDYRKDASSVSIPWADLIPYKRQSRTVFEQSGLEELAETMRVVGVLSPLLVRPIGDNKYEIIAGERRWRAAKIAGLSFIPCLVKTVDDETADKIHLYENIHRENLSNLDLAMRVEADMTAANGSLATVALKYGKSKSWVSKLTSIAGGGDIMGELVAQGVTADRAVLATVASIERKAPERAKALIQQLKAAPSTANKREIADKFIKQTKAEPKLKLRKNNEAIEAEEPDWRNQAGIPRELADAVFEVELSPLSELVKEFKLLTAKHGRARLANASRHPEASYAIVEFGSTGLTRRSYRADELRLLTVR